MSRNANIKSYIFSRGGEFLLLFFSVCAVSTVALNGFFLDGVTEQLGWAGRAGIVCCINFVLLVVLYAATTSRKNMLVFGIVYAVLLCVLLLIALAVSGAENIYDDAEGNFLYFAFVCIGFATAGFLLTRTLLGCCVWFVAVAFTCSVVQGFYRTEELFASVLCAFCALALIVYKNFRLGVESAQVTSNKKASGGFLQAILPVCGVFVAALALWFFVIAPLNPAVVRITLVTEYRTLPFEFLKGTAQEKPQLDFSYTSDNLVDGMQYTTDDLVQDANSSTEIEANSLLQQREQQKVTGTQGNTATDSGGSTSPTLDNDSPEEQFDAISYSWEFPWVILAIVLAVLFVCAVAAYFVARRAYRTHRLKTILAKKPAEQVKQLYNFELKCLGKLGFSVPKGATLNEYAHNSTREFEVITSVCRVPFSTLTKTYNACTYGRHTPTESEIVPFVTWYLNFWRAAYKQLGPIRYFFKSFRL